MNIHIVKNKYLNAFLILLLISAVIHFILLLGRALFFGDWQALNYIHILDIDWYVPGLLAGAAGEAISWAIAGGVYLAILKLNK